MRCFPNVSLPEGNFHVEKSGMLDVLAGERPRSRCGQFKKTEVTQVASYFV